MQNKTALIFTGQGFSKAHVKRLNSQKFFDRFLMEAYAEIFKMAPPAFESLSETDIKKNEISALILLSSAYKFIDEINETPDYVAGYSVGHYLALHAAGVISREATTHLVLVRCKLMNEAASKVPGTMTAITGLKLNLVEDVCAKYNQMGIITVSNDNAPGNVTISGEVRLMEAATEDFRRKGATHIQSNITTGAWHSLLMSPALAKLATEINKIDFLNSKIPVIENVNANILAETSVGSNLLDHLVSRVRWRESIQLMINSGVKNFNEATHFELLTRLGPYISRKAIFKSFGTNN
jgi:[acyl-carrier-protein] S-malonyltransferase